MFTKWINRIITAFLVPILMSPTSPVFLLKKAANQPKELYSISDSAVIEEKMHITAHRGVNAEAPENTLPAYQKAVEYGYYSAECDIKLTSDNVWVLAHNNNLGSKFWQQGLVAKTDFETLRTYTYCSGANFWTFPDLKIPTLDEFLDVFVGCETRPQIEIKTSNYDMLHTVIDAVRAKGLASQAIIISFDLKQLRILREYDKDIELWYLCYMITQKKIDEAKSLGNCWLSADYATNTVKTISKALDQNVGVSVWTVDTIKDAEKMYKLGMRYIETDRLRP